MLLFFCVSLRTMRQAFMFFFTGKKNQKPRRAKNSLWHLLNSLASWFAFSLSSIS